MFSLCINAKICGSTNVCLPILRSVLWILQGRSPDGLCRANWIGGLCDLRWEQEGFLQELSRHLAYQRGKYCSFHNARNLLWSIPKFTHKILDKLYRLIELDGSNLVSTNQVMEFISHLTNSRPRTGFDKSSLARLEQLFRTTVGNEQEIRREEFQKIVTSKNVS